MSIDVFPMLSVIRVQERCQPGRLAHCVAMGSG